MNSQSSPTDRARELLAAEFRKIGHLGTAEAINFGAPTILEQAALRAIEKALSAPPPTREEIWAETYAGFQQKRGMALDAILAAINEYDDYMTDDDYDAQGALDRIIGKLREKYRALSADLPGQIDEQG